jgi:anti-anti-sigma factor
MADASSGHFSASRFSVTPFAVPGGCRLAVRGEVDLESSPSLEVAIGQHARHGRKLHIDLSRVTFLDSSGIRLLVTTLRRSQREGFAYRVTLPRSAAARRALEVCRVDDLLVPQSQPGPTAAPARTPRLSA